MLFCGVDPGLNGAIVLIDKDSNPVFFDRMPLDANRKINPRMIYDCLYSIEDLAIKRMDNVFFAIEKVFTMPSDVENIENKITQIYNLLFSNQNFFGAGQIDVQQMFAELNAMVKKRDGRVGVLSIGINYGIILGAVGSFGWPYEIIPARTWQAAFWSGTDNKLPSKEKTFQKCRTLWPDLDFSFPGMRQKFHDGLCDAFAIAEIARQKYAAKNSSAA